MTRFTSSVKKTLTIYTPAGSISIPKGTVLYVKSAPDDRVSFCTTHENAFTGTVTKFLAKRHFTTPTAIIEDPFAVMKTPVPKGPDDPNFNAYLEELKSLIPYADPAVPEEDWIDGAYEMIHAGMQ